MTYLIGQGCCNDASCVAVCPVDCIRPRPGDPDFTTAEQLYIDAGSCIDCGACMSACPVDAITPGWTVDEKSLTAELNAGYFEGRKVRDYALPDIDREVDGGVAGLRVAIIGSGPAGSFLAEALTRKSAIEVSVFDRLPTPYGLVRSGVAPDHQRTKTITDVLEEALARPNVRCYFNVEVGRDITVDELFETHNAVVIATGASTGRTLGVPGEELDGVISAHDFVSWYNGHPDYAERTYDLEGVRRVVVIGNGNVAIDIVRVLSASPAHFITSDMPSYALEALKVSQVEQVEVVSRRSPDGAAYTVAEAAALRSLPGVQVTAVADHFTETADDPLHHGPVGALKSRLAREWASTVVRDDEGRIVRFRYGLSPVRINGASRVESTTFTSAVSGDHFDLPADLMILALGSAATPLAGVPFDVAAMRVPSNSSRVLDGGRPVEGLYCAGWVKRGPSGGLGSNKFDALDTADAILRDYRAGRLRSVISDAGALQDLLDKRAPRWLGYDGWKRIDAWERLEGQDKGLSARSKLHALDALVAVGSAPKDSEVERNP